MKERDSEELADMIANPHHHFTTPEEVLRMRNLHDRDKLAILQTMELDANELAVATAENMPGPDDGSVEPDDGADELKRVRDAIRSLRMNGENWSPALDR